MAADQPIIIIGHIDVDPADRDTVVAATADLQRSTREDEPGCLTYTIAADPADPGRIQIVEMWADAATLEAHESKGEAGWGNQIRSYVLQPYQMVKDLRTGVTSPTPSDVLDGDLDPFMAAALAQRVTGEKIAVEDVD